MKQPSRFSALTTVGILAALLLAKYLTPILPNHGAGRFLSHAAAIFRGRNPPSWDIIRSQNTGYYESLLSGRAHDGDGPTLLQLVSNPAPEPNPIDPYARGGFLVYTPKPNLRWVSTAQPKNLYTNSFGLADRQYAKTKPPETRRLAWIGDSVSRGNGVAMADRFETKFEKRLNDHAKSTTGEHFEVLNFSVGGYRNTQLFYVATKVAPAFHPDVYVVSLTQLSVAPNWGAHLAQLVHDGEDVKFDFLKQIVKESHLGPDDSPPVVEAKLAPYRLSVLREILRRLKSRTAELHAQLIVVLLPAVEDSETIQWRFDGIHELVESLGIDVIDLLDTYDGVRDIELLRLAWDDLHPNVRGHDMITDNLCQKLQRQPEVWAELTGMEDRDAAKSPRQGSSVSARHEAPADVVASATGAF